jgi:NhaP-type Na+/H+ or K+/H+ antiporter
VGETILGIGVILFLSFFFAALFERSRIPDVLLLTLAGIVLGPVTHLVQPQDLGKVGAALGTFTLVVLLGESGTALQLSVIIKHLKPTLSLTLATFIVTVGVVFLVARFGLGLSVLLAFGVGMALGGTSSAVVIPMVQSLKVREPAATILVIESALTDVLCIVLAIGFMEAASRGSFRPERLAGSVILALLGAGLIGLLGGVGWLRIVSAVRQLPNTAFATSAWVCILYGISEMIGVNGAIAALVFGVTLGNYRGASVVRKLIFREGQLGALAESDRSFYQEIIFFLKTFFFVYLGLSVRFSNRKEILLAVLAVVIIYLARPMLVRATMQAVSPSWEDSSMASVMVPKGLASAVLASVPLSRGLPGGETVQSFAYMVVLFSILATALLVPVVRHPAVASLCRSFFKSPSAPEVLRADNVRQ